MKEIYKGGYIIQPYAFNRLTVKGRPITKAETVVLSAIYSMSVKGGKARYSYRTLSQKFRLAKSTVARCVGNLCGTFPLRRCPIRCEWTLWRLGLPRLQGKRLTYEITFLRNRKFWKTAP